MFMMCSLAACTKEMVIKVPQYQQLQIQHPVHISPPVLLNPRIRALSATEIAADATKVENSKKIYYVWYQDEVQSWLSDELAKLEYAEYETRRANFYENFIRDYNKNILELNKDVVKKK